MDKKEDLKKKLREKIKYKELHRSNKENKNNFIYSNLKKSGVDPSLIKDELEKNPKIFEQIFKNLKFP